MIHLTRADYRIMPWANGRGQTMELWRDDHLRLSIATVAEDGPFSIFPGIARNLTVISGPGFHLAGDGIALHAAPLTPVTFPGDVAVRAVGVTAPSDDFNVMTQAAGARPRVWLAEGDIAYRERLFLLAIAPTSVNGTPLAPRDLLIPSRAVMVSNGPVVAVQLPS
jgi:uncharacterized protein